MERSRGPRVSVSVLRVIAATASDILLRPPPKADDRVLYGPHPAQSGDLWLPLARGPLPVPALLAIHGGYWRAENDLAHLGHLCAALRDAGAVVFNLEYRRLGMAKVGLREMLDDVTAGLGHFLGVMESLPFRSREPVLLGHSAGGHLALWLAKEARARGVIALAPLSDLRLASALRLDGGIADTLLASAAGTPEEVAAEASPIERLPSGARQVLLHGDRDAGVPVAMSEAYARRATSLGDPIELHVLAGADHLDLIDPERPAFRFVRDALASFV